VLWELLLQVLVEIPLELGLSPVFEPLRERNRANPLYAFAGLLLLGALAGLLSSLVWPTRILRPFPVQGVSVLVSPILAGAVMEHYGQWREERGKPRSTMATFWGGALFAFSMALVRFMWVGRPEV